MADFVPVGGVREITDKDEIEQVDKLLNTPFREEVEKQGGMASDRDPMYTQPDKTVGPMERLRLESEAETGVETTTLGAIGRLAGDVFFLGDTRKIAQKNALSDIMKREWTEYAPMQASPVAAGFPREQPRQKVTIDAARNPEALKRKVEAAGLNFDAVRSLADEKIAFRKSIGEPADDNAALMDAAQTLAENELVNRVHVSSRARRTLPGEGGKNKAGFGYSVIGGGLRNLPYAGQFTAGALTAGPAGLVLPLLAAYDRRYNANRESDYLIDPETGGVKETKAGLGAAEAVVPSMSGAIGEVAVEAVGGKVFDIAGKRVLGGLVSKLGGERLMKNSSSIRTIVKSFEDIAKVTGTQSYPAEIAEEWQQELLDAATESTEEYRGSGDLNARLQKATEKFGGNFGEIALSMILMQGGQTTIAAGKSIDTISMERKGEQEAASRLRAIGVDEETVKNLLADRDARSVIEYISNLSPEATESAMKRISARSVKAAEEIKKTTEWMDSLGDKGATSRFVAPSPADMIPGEDGVSRYVDPATDTEITYDRLNNEVGVRNGKTGRYAFVSDGPVAERMQRAFAVADTFDKEAQGRDIVNEKKRETLARVLEAKGVDGTYVIVNNVEELAAQKLSKTAEAAYENLDEMGVTPQAFVDTGDAEGDTPVTYFVLDHIRLGEGPGAIAKTMQNIVDAATHEPVHLTAKSPKAAAAFRQMYDKADERLRLEIISEGIRRERGKAAVKQILDENSASADDTPKAADAKDENLRRWFEEGIAYLNEGTITEQSTGVQRTARKVRDFFKADIKTLTDIGVLTERAMKDAKGTVIVRRGNEPRVISGQEADTAEDAVEETVRQAETAKETAPVAMAEPAPETPVAEAAPVEDAVPEAPEGAEPPPVEEPVVEETTVQPPAQETVPEPVQEQPPAAQEETETTEEPAQPPAKKLTRPQRVAAIKKAFKAGEPVSADEIDALSMNIPDTYARQGDKYVKLAGVPAEEQKKPTDLIAPPEIPVQTRNRTGTTRPVGGKERGETNVGESAGQALDGRGNYVADEEIDTALQILSGSLRGGIDSVASYYRSTVEKLVKELSNFPIEVSTIQGFPPNTRPLLAKIILGRPLDAQVSTVKLADYSEMRGKFKNAANYVREGDLYVFKPETPPDDGVPAEEQEAVAQSLTDAQRSFGEELAKKYGAPVKPIKGAIEPYESLARFGNMLEKAADKTTDADELAKILDQSKVLGQESRIVWAILNNPHTSDEVYAMAKKNEAVRAMTSDENIARLDIRRKELREQRGLDKQPSERGVPAKEQKPAVAPEEAVAPVSAPAEPEKGTEETSTISSKPEKKETIDEAGKLERMTPEEQMRAIGLYGKDGKANMAHPLAARMLTGKMRSIPVGELITVRGKPDTLTKRWLELNGYTLQGDRYVAPENGTQAAETPAKPVKAVGALKHYPQLETEFEKDRFEWLLKEKRSGAVIGRGKTRKDALELAERTLLWQQSWNKEYKSVFEMVDDFLKEKKIDKPPYGLTYKYKPTKQETIELFKLRREQLKEEIEAEKKRAASVGALPSNQFNSEFLDKLNARISELEQPTTKKEATDAKSIRGDEGQVRAGGEKGQPEVQRGAKQGGGNLQRQAPEAPRGEQGTVKAPELMTPEEGKGYKLPRGRGADILPSMDMMSDGKTPVSSRASEADGTLDHAIAVATAVRNGKPVNASAVDTYGIKLPPGYVREGDLYVFKPETPPDDGGKKPISPSVRERETQARQEVIASSDVSGRTGPTIPKGAKVVTTYDDKGVSYSGEFVRDNGDGTSLIRAFGERPKKGLFRRYGVGRDGVQTVKDIAVSNDKVKMTEPPADLSKLTPAQRTALRRAASAQESVMDTEIAAGETANADVVADMAAIEERGERKRTDNEIMFRVDQNKEYNLEIKLTPKEDEREFVRNAVGAIRRRMLENDDERGIGERFRTVEPVFNTKDENSRSVEEVAIAEIERVFRKTIVFVEGGNDFGGLVNTEFPNIIFINARSTIPYLQIAGHELSHTMELDEPKLYSDTLRLIAPILGRSSISQRLVSDGTIKNNAELREYVKEMSGDLFGEQFSDPTFWDLVHAENPSLFSRLTDYVLRWIDKVFSNWQGERIDSTPFFGDLKETRNIIASATAKYGTMRQRSDDIRFRVDQNEEQDRVESARKTFRELVALMENNPADFRLAQGEPQTRIDKPVIFDKQDLQRVAKVVTGSPLPTPASVSQSGEMNEAMATFNEYEVRSIIDRVVLENRPIENNDTVAKIRIFLQARLEDAAQADDDLAAAMRKNDTARQYAIVDTKDALLRDLDQASRALDLIGSERGRQLAFLKTGLDRNLSVVYRVSMIRKITGRMVTVEEYDKIVERVKEDRKRMKELAANHEKVRLEEAKKFREATETARAEAEKKALEAYRRGVAEERANFAFVQNDADADFARRVDPSAGYEGFNTDEIAFRIDDTADGRNKGTYPGALRDLARSVFTQVKAEGGGTVTFARRMFEQGRAKGFDGKLIDRYVYDFNKRLGIAILQDAPAALPPRSPSDNAARIKNADARRTAQVKEAVRRAVAEDMEADGGKIAKRAIEILDKDQSEWAYLSPEDVMSIVTGYPAELEADTRDELEKRYSMIRNHMRTIQRIEEMKRGKYPTPMTLGNDAPDVTLRQLAREMRDMMNAFEFEPGETDPRMVNAQMALRNRLRYSIEELEKSVKFTKQPINEKVSRAIEETPEIRDLRNTLAVLREAYEALPAVEEIREARDTERARRAANNRYHFWNKRLEDAKNGVFPETFKGTETADKDAEIASYRAKAEAARKEYWEIKKSSPQERLAAVTAKVTKAEERLASLEKDLAQTPVADPRAKKPAEMPPASPEEAAKRERLEELRTAISNVRKNILAKWRDENAEAIERAREADRFQFLVAKAKEIERKIKARDFAKTPKRPRVWSARIAIEEDKVRAGLRAINEHILWEANNAAGWTGKAKNVYTWSGNAYRFFKASMDLSNLGVQSARLFSTDPIAGAKLVKEAVSNAGNDERMAEFMSQLHNDPTYDIAYEAGLALDQQFDDVFGTGMGETFFRKLAEYKEGQGLGREVVSGAAGIALASQRVFDMYGRAMRFHVFKSIVNDPAHANLTKPQLRAIANMVNIMGGVGNTRVYSHGWSSVLSELMWSSRLFTSQWQTLAGGGGILWNAGLGPEGSKQALGREWWQTAAPGALKLYARSLAGNMALSMLFASVGMMLGDRQPWEDDETFFWKAWDFLFGRRVIGSKNIDVTGGLTSYIALLRRVVDRSHVSMSGKTVPDDDWKAWAGTTANFFRGRLRPDLALVISMVFGEDVTGEPFGPRGGIKGTANAFFEATLPITPREMIATVGDMWNTHGVIGVTAGLIPALASDLFGFSKSTAPRDPRYEINRHKSRMGQVRKALEAGKESGDYTEYMRLRDVYAFDVDVSDSVSKLESSANKAKKIADNEKIAADYREEARQAEKWHLDKAREILRGQR